MGTLQQQSVLKGHQTGREKEKDLVHELFGRAAAAHPEKIAIHYEDNIGQEHVLSFEELDKVTNRLARALRKYNKFGTTTSATSSSSQSFVAVCVKPSDRLPAVLLAILKAGMAYLPLDAEFPTSRVKHILEEAQPLMVLAEDGADLSIYDGALVVTYEQLLEEAEREQEDALTTVKEANQIAIVLYTSGSTGVPKGVLIPHATLLNRLQWQWRELPYADDEEECVFKTSLTFVDSVPEIWGPLLQGRTLVVVPKSVTKDPERFVQLLDKHRIQRLTLVPSLLRSLFMYLGLHDNDNALGRLTLWICSGETLPVALADQFFATFGDHGKTLANFYGSTEVMGDVTYHLLSKRAQLQGMEKVPIGKPVDNCIIYLVNKDMRLAPQGEVGELIVAGRNLAAGYIRGRDAHKFLDNPHAIDPEYPKIFRTGDYAKIVKGSIIYEGRVDSQIKIRGHRVDLTEVERAIARIPDIDKVVVLCYKPGELSQALIAFITTVNGKAQFSQEVESLLQRMLPPYMLPQIVIIDRIPLLTNGKTDRQALLKQYESSCPDNEDEVTANCDYSGVPSQDLVKAHVLFPTIASVIGRNSRAPVTSQANFYELGGNSLNSIYAVTKLRDQGYQIGITDFITAKNLADILDHMKLESSEEEPLEETIDQGSYIFEPLHDSHKEDAIVIITESFYAKSDLEQWLMPDISRADYKELMEAIWQPLVEKGLSFVMKSMQTGKTIGVALNFDLWDEPEVVLSSKLMIVFDFLEYLEAPIREYKLPKGKDQIIHNFMMTTSTELNAAENVLAMRQMEEHCLEFAKQKKFAGIFTTNTSPLTQQLGTDVYGYESMLVYQVNKYEIPDGSKPFGKAPDSQLAICSLKMIK
ncbi:PREDICTED: mycosubtilin synthase subunit C [Dinoponera quadriceps]|uniref:Mycosubtilin synthase subunit C n=1 Tax=Dinoponera quadriceps TaxID=609295 RepID=A0A6P3XYH6_DINQU|nr:PREDICTED: mycosubtilin synthase subunit C [Dinoponera quadriceps]XP_014483039.1 PREDICTED: mycosubtilin synthase subunit C [Dinoponera quadriceps]